MKVYLYGNCQMTALGRMMLEQHPEWDVSSLDVSTIGTVGSQDTGRHLAAARAADVIIAHPIGDYRGEDQLSLETLRAAIRGGTDLITLPSIVFEGTHGAFTYLGGRLQGYFMPYNNSHTIEMHLRDYHRKDACMLQASPDFYTAEFVHGGIEASLNALRAKEELHRTTIKVSPLLDESCRSTLMVNTINHPNRPFLARVLNETYRVMSIRSKASEAGEDYLGDPMIPPLPTVLHHLGIADTKPEFRRAAMSWSRERYLQESMGYYGRLIRPDLIRAFKGSRGESFLEALHGSRSWAEDEKPDHLPASREQFVQSIVAEVFQVMLNREPTPDESVAHSMALHDVGLRAWLQMVSRADESRSASAASRRETGASTDRPERVGGNRSN